MNIEPLCLATCENCNKSRAFTFMIRTSEGKLLCKSCWEEYRKKYEKINSKKYNVLTQKCDKCLEKKEVFKVKDGRWLCRNCWILEREYEARLPV